MAIVTCLAERAGPHDVLKSVDTLASFSFENILQWKSKLYTRLKAWHDDIAGGPTV